MLLVARLAKHLQIALRPEKMTPQQREEALEALAAYDRRARIRFINRAEEMEDLFDAEKCIKQMPYLAPLDVYDVPMK